MAFRPEEGEGASSASLMANIAEIIPSLLLESRCPPYLLRQYGGFWLPEATLRAGLPAVHAFFQPRPTDVLLASYPKAGTTWLKALAFAALNRTAHSPSDDSGHPLRHRNPHELVKFLETIFRFAENIPRLTGELDALPSPRLFATHLPYSLLPERVKDGCRIVYICRDPKDVLVSAWWFKKKMAPAVDADAEAFTFQEAFELFCEGRSVYGPQWQHILQYWAESVRRPDSVLFLRYEDMLLEPKSNLKRLAKFMGCEFSEQEVEAGMVDKIVELCCLDKLKNMEVNRNGSTPNLKIKNEAFFRRGVVGDWTSHMTPEMARRLDRIVEDATQGSGLSFSNSA